MTLRGGLPGQTEGATHTHDGSQVSGIAPLISIYKRQIIDALTEADISDLTHYTDSDADTRIAAVVTQAFVEALTIDIAEAQITDLDHTDTAAIHDNTAAEISAITSKTTPVGGDLLLIEDSAASNAKKRLTLTNLFAALPAWTTWAPTWAAGLTAGNGSWDYARYVRIGKTIIAQGEFTFGTTTSVSGAVKLDPPVSMQGSTSANNSLGTASFLESGVARSYGRVFDGGSDELWFRVLSASGTYVGEAELSSTVPFTWGTGDVIGFSIIYEAA